MVAVIMKECKPSDWDRHANTIDLTKLNIHDSLVKTILSTLNTGNVLEIGAQSGIDAEFLASSGLNVTAMDYSDVAIRLLRGRRGIEICKADALSMPFSDNSFDLVYSQGLLEHFREPQLTKLMKEQKRVVKDGGHVLIDVPNSRSLPTVVYKQLRMALDRWIVPWETQFSSSGLRRLGEKHDFFFEKMYSYGYIPLIGRKLDAAMNFCFRESYREFEKKFGSFYQPCIGILFRNKK
jgi:ubiquinone/menaquinone biosynthesis C-methylase UbiE